MEAKKKYELTDSAIEFDGSTLYQIKALRNFGNVKSGDLGGWIEKEENLSQIGNAWIGGDAKVCKNAKVFGYAQVYGDAIVSDNAEVFGNAKVFGDAWVFGKSKVYGNAEVHGNAKVYGNARVYDNAEVYGKSMVYGDAQVYGRARISGDAMVRCGADYIIFKNFWSSGRFFTWTKSNNMWKVGCFYGTGEELIEKAYKDSAKSGREYERVVRYVDSILANK